MATTFGRRALLAAAAACLAGGVAVQLPALAAPPGPGTWTAITSPHSGWTTLQQFGHEGDMTVTGTAFAGVSTVNVYCLRGSGSSVDATTVATSVPVTSGAFSTTVPVPSGLAEPQCRLRALPSTVNPAADYLASYAGPVVNLDSWRYFPSQDTAQLQASAADGTIEADGLGVCSAATIATILPDETVPGGSDGCLYSLGAAESGASAHSTIRVDGHEAFTTSAALLYGLTPTSLATRSFRRWHGSGVRWTEVMPVDRCTSDVAFPPDAGTCPAMVSTGVEIRQVSTFLPAGANLGGHLTRIRTELRSVDGKRHVLQLAYYNHLIPVAGGELGFRFPHQSGWHASTTGETVTKLGTGTGSLLARTNMLAREGDPAVSTRAITWSRAPSAVTFSSVDPTTFTMAYRLVAPKGGSVRLGFDDAEGIQTGDAQERAIQSVFDMVNNPRITSPRNGADIHGRTTKVTGVVTVGANGLPTVKVNGHPATLKPNKAGTRATFSVTFTESLGKHTLVAVATDAAGNKAFAQRVVHNVP